MEKLWKDKEWLEKELKSKFIKEIAREYNIADSIIHYWCKKHNLKSKYLIPIIWQNKEWLSNELNIKTVKQIANENNTDISVIWRWIHRHKLEYKLHNSGSRKFTQKEVEKKFKEKGWKLIDIYKDNKYRVNAICQYCGKSKLVIPYNIFNGHSKSCGCISHQLVAQKRNIALPENGVGYLYPEIVKLYSKNNKKSIFEINPGSEYKYLWICEKYGYKHQYKCRAHDIIKGCRCPYCSSHQVLVGFNDLASQRPDLLIDWNYEKNIIKPTEVTCGSGKKIWWKCSKCDYQWKTTIYNRSNDINCPNCYPKSKGEEQIKTFFIRNNIKFEREKRFSTCRNKNPLPFDFYLSNYNLLIEFNGKQHYEVCKGYFEDKTKFSQRQLHDQIKKDWAISNNYTLLIIPYWDQDKIEDILTKEVKNGNTSS